VIANAAIQKHNDKAHVRSPNNQVGDYVLVAEHRKSGVSKLQVKCKGPRRVASVKSDYVFVVENLLTKELKAAHATRLRFYKDKELNVTAELAQAAEHNDHQLYVVFYALLRMRPLSRSWAECSVVISCGKVDYDKSG
jgi:hypothetical protein